MPWIHKVDDAFSLRFEMSLLPQNKALHEDLQRENKLKLQHKLMMKFREDRISELERLVKTEATDDIRNLVKQKDAEIQVIYCHRVRRAFEFHEYHPCLSYSVINVVTPTTLRVNIGTQISIFVNFI